MSCVITIAGGGMVGASLALSLQGVARELGWSIRLIEAHPPVPGSWQPSYDARSTALSQGSRQIYQRLGVWEHLAQRIEPIREIHVSDRGHPGAARIEATIERVPALGYVVENAWLGDVLLGALDQDVVQWMAPARVLEAQAESGGYRLKVEVGESVSEMHTDLLVIADGGRSSLLDQLRIYRKVQPYSQAALIANVTTAAGHGSVAYERFTSTGPLALLPLSGNRSALVWTLPEEQAADVASLAPEQFLDRLQQAFGFRMGTLTQVGERACYPLKLIEAEEQIRTALVVLGNAAHSLHPIAGQGFNLSLRDTQALAQALICAGQAGRRPGELAVLQGYLDGQRSDQWLTTAFSDRLTRLFSNRRPLMTVGRNLGLLGLDVLPPAKRLFARQAMGL
ncbi:2-octaprenyl-6-methoxyphenyl hydroxylase [Halopseudomonas nanhaiensis]|uniref:2-octaprenyl-6-methoxyphenyl hydroxylase n=1 Tax=Halopseudomonas nanhaiensis TaxID=2830842 RepID=UPI001CBD8C95|nr:2-octaprenyl-6-methoxyphenyl hydroxylase [Halopseudomonas nanhaiensis]UAW98849.1 2-octaprenyl-6-methoxyphenyl hydroxylase [Halopseudomonas nanhaiensis]